VDNKTTVMNQQQLNQQMQNAVQLHQQGELKKAEVIYRAALQMYPQQADILNLLGTLCSQDQRAEEGVGYLKKSLSLQPGHPHTLLNLGQAQVQLGQLDDAIKNFQAVLVSSPQSSVAHFNLANCYKQRKQLVAALPHYQQAVALAPGQDKYLYNYANSLQAAGHYKTAIEVFRQSLKINPANAQAHNNLGTVLSEWDKDDEAKTHYLEAIALQPDFIDARHNLFQYYEANGETSQAIGQLHTMVQRLPHDPHLALKQALVFPIITQSQDEITNCFDKLSQAITTVEKNTLDATQAVRYDLSFPSIAIYYGQNDCQLRKDYAALFNSLIQPLPALPTKNALQKPQIAFIVTRGHEGVFIKCMAGLIKQLPDTLIATIVCSSPNGKTILSEALADQTFLEISGDLATAAEQIHQAEFDVLYYWEVGTDSMNYFLPFYKPARIQVGFWGWPVTSGIDAMDYYCSSELLETDNPARHYSEKLIQLPRLPVFYYRPPVPEDTKAKTEFGFDHHQTLYLCAQNLRKVHPDMDAAFKAILQADQKAQVLLIEDKREHVTQVLKTRLENKLGDDAARLHFMARMPAEDYLALVKTVDVMLDTFHYTGGANTNYDAFAAGTPVVTLPTQFHRGRYTYAAYLQMGYLDCVAKDAADYVRIALALANDRIFAAAASQAVLNGCTSLLEDQSAVDGFVASVFELYEGINQP
jgi:protein O-GlcNAc transferase